MTRTLLKALASILLALFATCTASACEPAPKTEEPQTVVVIDKRHEHDLVPYTCMVKPLILCYRTDDSYVVVVATPNGDHRKVEVSKEQYGRIVKGATVTLQGDKIASG